MPILSETHREHCWHTMESWKARYEYQSDQIPEGQTVRKCCKCIAYEVVPAP